MKDLLWFHSLQRLVKLRCIGKKQERKARTTNIHYLVGPTTVSSDLLCRGLQKLSPLKKPITNKLRQTLQISLLFAPRVFSFADASHLSPSLLLTLNPPPPALRTTPAASPGICGCVSARHQPKITQINITPRCTHLQ